MATICQVCGKVCKMQCEPFQAGDCLVCKICYDKYKDRLKLHEVNPIKDPLPKYNSIYEELADRYSLPIKEIIRIHLALLGDHPTLDQGLDMIRTLLGEL